VTKLRAVMLVPALLILPFAADGQARTERPTLIVLLTVDQMRGDYLDRFRSGFTGGFARLLRDGAVFTNARQDHGLPGTAAGHATIGTGRWPRSHGILRNVESVPDSASPLLEAAGDGASPRGLQGTTLFDWIQARWPDARALSVSLKDRSAILPVGHARQHVYWYAGRIFTTSRWYGDSLPDWVRRFNRGLGPAQRPGRAWTLLRPRAAYPEPDSMPYENAGDFAFPHGLPGDTLAAAAQMRLVPWGDSVTLALALEGVNRLRLGRGPGVDFLAVSLSVTDYVGHRYGPNSLEIHDQMLWLDRYLGQFLDALARRVPRNRTLVVLTADHGVTAYPEWTRENGDPAAAYINREVDTVLVEELARLTSAYGRGRWIQYREYGLVVFDRAGLRRVGVDPDSLAEVLAARLRPIEGILRVDTRRSLWAADSTVSDGVRRWQHHLAPDTPGDLMITPAENRVISRPGEARHGFATDADTWVGLVFSGPGIRPGRYAGRANTVDIAPTVAHLLGVAPLEPVNGRVLSEALAEGRRQTGDGGR
jgi:predicted AlkP superfamily pyrophosphatase or phosphodiesterase